MMLSGAGVALRVITAPNSAFAQIRDNDGAYFVWSVCIFALSSFLVMITVAILYPYFLTMESAFLESGFDLLGGTAVTALVYLIGRLFGGNGNWRQVFSAVFTNVVFFPMLVAVVALLSLTGNPPALASMGGGSSMLATLSMAPLSVVGQQDFAGSGPGAGGMVDTLTSLIISIVVLAAFIVWYVVVSVKAVKTVNGFGTAKAFGLLVVANVAYVAAFLPFSA